MNWEDHELDNAPLGDQRLTRRAKTLLESMISQPSARLASHQDATKIRMADHDVVLCLQDTTELNYSNQTQTITWILLTNLEVTCFEQAIEKIQWYLCRWQIEIYFRILKSGCKIEKL